MTRSHLKQRRLARWALGITVAFLLAAVAAPLAVADEHGKDDPSIPTDPCACTPELRIREIPGQLGMDPHDPDREAYRGTVIVDLILPDDCDCFVEGWQHASHQVTTLPGTGQVIAHRIDDTTWAFTAPDANTHHVKLTVHVHCVAEHPCHECEGAWSAVTLDWYQFN